MAQITLHDYLQETEDAISSSRIDDALTRCQHMLSYFPEALEIQRLLGEVYLAQGNLEEAQHLFDWVLTNDPENVFAYCNRADVSERMSEYDTALDCYQQAYELNGRHGQIREEFNRLSEKVGQKGFMLSRAGLARLYMRGDLLSQAMQEWDAVLAVASDRLDARIGQLETYWRAGLVENVEQLATGILQDVPGCLKALLLLANVVAAKDSFRTQELLQRVEALDPDYVTAQELFADALASQPDDPFIQRLKKAPVLLPEARPAAAPVPQQQSNTTIVASENSTMSWWENEDAQKSPSIPAASQPIPSSATLQAAWHTPIPEIQNVQPAQETPVGGQEPTLEPWELFENALNQFHTTGEETQMDTANPMAQYKDGMSLWGDEPGPVAMSQPDSGAAQSTFNAMPTPKERTGLSDIGLDLLWGAAKEEPPLPPAETVPNPPSWLNMLAQPDTPARKSDPSVSPVEPLSDSGLPLADTSLEQLTMSDVSSSEAQDSGSFMSSAASQPPSPAPAMEKAESQSPWMQPGEGEKLEDDEESFFGPSWLKSLGAAELPEEEAPAASASTSEAQTQRIAEPEQIVSQVEVNTQYVVEPEYTTPQREEQYHRPLVPEANPYELWSSESSNSSSTVYERTSWASAQPEKESWNTPEPSHENTYLAGNLAANAPVAPRAEQPLQVEPMRKDDEQNLLTTLEELEQSLRSKGFIPLEPNALSTLAAQTQADVIPSQEPDAMQVPQEYNAPQAPQPIISAYNVPQAPQPIISRQEPQETLDTSTLSSALAQLGSFAKEPPDQPVAPSLASSFERLEQNDEPSWLQALKSSSTPPAVPTTPTWHNPSIEPSAPVAFTPNLPLTPPIQVEPSPASSRALTPPAAKEVQQVQAPAPQANPLLDSELEMTMRRPAVRLQPMQRRSAPSQGQGGSPASARSQSGERTERALGVTRPVSGNLSYRDRLIRGYQHQLVGDYDEAMQEYRLIIRNATDLLAEVISNVRALLKLAPNYSAGYRVLGDAYMRQGEYLQAMEAYNKALSMTKKVKSQA